MSRNDQRFRVSTGVMSKRLGDDIVLVHLQTSKIFELTPTAALFWELIASGATRGEARRTLLERFDVTAAQLDEEIEGLLAALQNEKMVVCDDPA